jgi:hypothetical protein
VRVVDLDREAECETNPDPRALGDVPPTDPAPAARRLGCFPLGDPSTPPRSALATSPGIQLPGSSLPRDVAFVHLDVPAPVAGVAPPSAGPGILVGDFAWVISSDGRGTLVNLYDACPAPNMPQTAPGGYTPACDVVRNADASRAAAAVNPGSPVPMTLDRIAHRVRPSTARFLAPTSTADIAGAPRLQDPRATPFTVTVNGTPQTESPGLDGGVVVAGPLDAGVVAPSTESAVLPSLAIEGGPLADGTSRYLQFFDPDRVRNETWSVGWEAVLPGTARTLGRPSVDGQGVFILDDAGGAFCTRGVLAGDKLELTGCNSDSDCDFQQQCVRDPAAPVDIITGLCLDRANVDAQQRACGPLLRALRAYRITSAKQGISPSSGESTDRLVLGEIYEPEQPVDTRECDPVTEGENACSGITILDAGGTVALPTRCLIDFDGKHRCLRDCGDELGAVAHTGSGTGTLVAARSTPAVTPSAATVRVRITATGALGTATFDVSVDDGKTFVPGGPTGNAFALADVGITISFRPGAREPSFVAGDEYRFVVVPDYDRCGLDFQCATPRIGGGERRCLRAPLDAGLFATCLRELQPYQVRVGGSFLVTGSLSGAFVDVQPDPQSHECRVPATGTEYTRLHQARIPLPAPACPAQADRLAALPRGDGNACQFVDGGASGAAGGDRLLHFENPLFSFLLRLPGLGGAPAPTTVLSFVLVGGGLPMSTALATDVQAQQPVSAVTAPDRDSVFVVDEGKQTTATGLRGQLLKLSTSAASVDRRFQVR